MKGYLWPQGDPPERSGELPAWERRLADAVGTAIEFWGFKSNHGRVWVVLYLDQRPLAAADLQRRLGLSKGAVSMVTRELEHWGVIHRLRLAGSDCWHFQAETDFWRMLRGVFEQREGQFIRRIALDLELAEREARAASVDRETLRRIQRLRALARLAQQALDAFLRTARLDATSFTGALLHAGRGALRRHG